MATTRFDVVFSTGRFNLREPKDYFINDCCFGDDVARWLAEQLRARGMEATDPDQEDWGWYLNVRCRGTAYFVGVGGTPPERPAECGEWRLVVEKHRTLRDRLTRRNYMAEDDPLLAVLTSIVCSERDFAFVGIE